MALFCLYCLKYLVLPISLNEIPTLLVLGGLTGLFHSTGLKKEKDEFKDEIDKLQAELDKTKKIQEEILSGVTQLKLSQGFRSVAGSK